MNRIYIEYFTIHQVTEKEVQSALLGGDPHDQLKIAYHLIIDNKRIADESAKLKIKDFFCASTSPVISPNSEVQVSFLDIVVVKSAKLKLEDFFSASSGLTW